MLPAAGGLENVQIFRVMVSHEVTPLPHSATIHGIEYPRQRKRIHRLIVPETSLTAKKSKFRMLGLLLVSLHLPGVGSNLIKKMLHMERLPWQVSTNEQ